MKAADLKAVGPMMVLLNDAILPNLVQTTEGAPAIVHCGPFANIAHGTSSVLAQRMGLHLADYVVNETGFAADLGAEKFFDIVMPMCGHVPSAAVVIVTLKALRAQGGSPDGPVEAGFPNLARHLDNLKRWGVPPVVALNRFPGDTDDDLERCCLTAARSASRLRSAEGYTKGGDGMTDLAEKVVAAAATSDPQTVEPLYTSDQTLDEKITTIATKVYGARRVVQARREFAARKVRRARLRQAAGLHRQDAVFVHRRSEADWARRSGWTLTITDVTLSAGAGFVVAIAGSMMLMPGLGKVPQAQKLDVDDQGASSAWSTSRQPKLGAKRMSILGPASFVSSGRRRDLRCLSSYCCFTTQDFRPDISPAEMQAIVQRYVAWRAKVQAERPLGHGPQAARTERSRAERRRRRDTVLDGPYPEAREVLGGLFVDRGAQLRRRGRAEQGLPAPRLRHDRNPRSPTHES